MINRNIHFLFCFIFFTSILLYFNKTNDIVNLYKGGAVKTSDIEPIQNKEFFINPENSVIINELLTTKHNALQYLDDIEHTKERQEDTNLIRTTIHVGQLKLLLSELEFLTEVLDDNKANATVIYAGSAPSNKIYYLSTLYPNVKFILVDPNEHFIMFEDGNHYESKKSDMVIYLDTKNKNNKYGVKKHVVNLYNGKVEKKNKREVDVNFKEYYTNKEKKNYLLNFIKNSNYRFYIIEDLFTNDIADLFKDIECYFISDIRSNINDMNSYLSKINKMQVRTPTKFSTEESPSDLDICWNNAMHLNWLQRLQPKKAMLKFRAPWFDPEEQDDFNYYSGLEPFKSAFSEASDRGIDFIQDYNNKKFNYIKDEKIYIQSFPGQGSSESRLICSKYNDYKPMDLTEYDNKFYYYNWFYRQFAFVDHGAMDKKLGIDGCNDCALMVKIFRDYFEKYKIKYDNQKVINEVRTLLRIIRRTIKKELHGYFMKPYKNTQEIVKQQVKYILLNTYENYEDELIQTFKP